jgi:hypothetical protein
MTAPQQDLTGMTKLIFASLLALAATACAREGSNESQEANNLVAEGGADLNAAIGGDELSPIPEAEDDMIANDSRAAANQAPAGNQPAPALTPR